MGSEWSRQPCQLHTQYRDYSRADAQYNAIDSYLTITQLRKVFLRFRGRLLRRYAFQTFPFQSTTSKYAYTAGTKPKGLRSRLPLTIYKFKCSFQIFFNIIQGMLSREPLPSVLTDNRAVYWHCAVSNYRNVGPKNINRHEAIALSSHWNAPRLWASLSP